MKKDVNLSLVQGGKLTKSGWLSIVAFLLVAVLALSVALGLVVKSGKEKAPAEEASIGGGMVVPEETEENGISLLSTVIPKEQYEDYGIMPIAESAQQLTARVSPSINQVFVSMDWSVGWKEGTSGKWGNGKTVTEYVTVTPTSDGALTANVQCLQAFGEQIIVTATVRGNEEVKATCTVDYASTLSEVYLEFTANSHTWYASTHYSGGDHYTITHSNEGSNTFPTGNATVTLHKTMSSSKPYTVEDPFGDVTFNMHWDKGFKALLDQAISKLGSSVSSSTKSKINAAFSGSNSLNGPFTTSSPTKLVDGGTVSIPDLTYRGNALDYLFGLGQSPQYVTAILPVMTQFYKDNFYATAVLQCDVSVKGTYSNAEFTLSCGFGSDYFASDVTSASFDHSELTFGGI